MLQRRDFLRKSCIGSLGLLAGSSILTSFDAFAGDNEKLKILDGKISSPFMEIQVSASQPGIHSLNIDGLGLSKRGTDAIKGAVQPVKEYSVTESSSGDNHIAEYRLVGQPARQAALWSINIESTQIKLTSSWSETHSPEPFVLNLSLSSCHTTLLGVFNADGNLKLPAIMHLPGQGSIKITSKNEDASIGYSTEKTTASLKIVFPAAAAGSPVEYLWEITAIYPDLPGIKGDPRFDSFKRNWLNVLQLNPKTKLLSNNAASTSCAFCYYEYADVAVQSPELVPGLSALDIVRQTLDNILAGAHAYGLPAPGNFPVESSDSLPSMLIAATNCTTGGKHDQWLAANYQGIKGWADKMLATDNDGNGLFEYIISGNSGIWPDGTPKTRPSNWWDTIGFGHEDAYANALSYRALNGMVEMANRLGKKEDSSKYAKAAAKLKDNYFKTFYNPATGVIGGWRSADGHLHDYYFLWVNGIAILYGLVPKAEANKIMDVLLEKIKEVGYTQYNMGLPGNLVTVALKDYVHKDADGHHGGGVREDNADGFQNYENGGATGCFAYFTLAALYSLGRKAEADKILFPMLGEYEKGGFEGRGAKGRSNDWRRWDGTPMGYEGFLVDNYYTLLAVPLRQKGKV